ELLGRLVRIPVLLIPRRTASVLLRLPLLLATVDPVAACVLAFLLLVSRRMSPRLSGPPRVVAVPPAVLSSLPALPLWEAGRRTEEHGCGEHHDRDRNAIHAPPPGSLRRTTQLTCRLVLNVPWEGKRGFGPPPPPAQRLLGTDVLHRLATALAQLVALLLEA